MTANIFFSALLASGIKTRLYYWSRCDVPFVLNNVTVMPDKCIPFESVKTNFIQIFRESLAEAVHVRK